AIHQFFYTRGFVYIHTPVITAIDAEGAGAMFQVTTLDTTQSSKDASHDFFGQRTHLTVSGQLEAEAAAMGLGAVYTFGPTFRAENSNTTRHLAEFWMVEPEVAFADLADNMVLAELFLKSIIRYVLDHCADDLAFLQQRAQEALKDKKQAEESLPLVERLETILDGPFACVTYTEAIEILKASKPNKKGKFQYVIQDWGVDLQSEHERYLVAKHFKKPVIVTDYPKAIKAFYMRQNDDNKTVAAMDVLFPGIGEIIGGSQREERLDRLQAAMDAFSVDTDVLQWYLDTRRFGAVPHSGFGLGLERLVQFITGMENIRDVIPFPRTPGNAAF
ncbi:MAG: asparagine--tRNA ligase, partial [Bacteroidota bacterium]